MIMGRTGGTADQGENEAVRDPKTADDRTLPSPRHRAARASRRVRHVTSPTGPALASGGLAVHSSRAHEHA
jgi:hypothetical protein